MKTGAKPFIPTKPPGFADTRRFMKSLGWIPPEESGPLVDRFVDLVAENAELKAELCRLKGVQ